MTKQYTEGTVESVKGRERWALGALALTGWTAAGFAMGGFIGFTVCALLVVGLAVKARGRETESLEPAQEKPRVLADIHLVFPEGVTSRDLPDGAAGHVQLDAHTDIEEAAEQARRAKATYIITCNGGGRQYGYIHTSALYDMAKELPETNEERTILSDTSVWRARRDGIMIPKGRWQTVGGWICDVTGWGVLQEGQISHENWEIDVRHDRGKRYFVTLQKREPGQ